MIVSVFKSDDNEFVFVTNGCGCCSSNYYHRTDDDNGNKEEIIYDLKRNLEVAKEGFEALGLDIKDYL